MAETVYVLGAGINRSIKDASHLRPPLATDLFKQALRHELLDETGRQELKDLFAYIWRYWRYSVEDLREEPFDLEACFTMLQQQRIEADEDGDERQKESISQIEDQLTALLTRYLAYIEHFSSGTSDLGEVGKQVLSERAAVLTFNYDTIVESAIEEAGGTTDESPPEEGTVLEEHLSYSEYKWNRALAFGVRFDEVHIQQKRVVVLEPVVGERFYGHPDNELYPTPILKLHGSLNWFIHTSRQSRPNAYGATKNPKEGSVVLASGYPHVRHGFGTLDDLYGWVLRPMIVTPVLYKDLVGKGVVGQSWRIARKELSTCRRLVVAGYSFPATDFATRRLFLEAFADSSPKELVSVNPSRSVAGEAAFLCHFRNKPLVRENLEEFLEHP